MVEEEQEQTQEPEEAKQEETSVDEVSFCKRCSKEVVPILKSGRYYCPDCKVFVPNPGGKKKQSAREVLREREYRITAQKPFTMSGREMAMAEILINAGLAKDFSDLTRKGLYVMSAMFHLPQAKMEGLNLGEKEKQEPDPKRTMRELQEQKLIEAYIDNMSQGNKTDPFQLMMLMRMMDNKGQGRDEKDNDIFKKMMDIQLIKSLTQDQNPQAFALEKQIADLKSQIQMQQMISQMNQSKTPIQDQMMALEKIRGERDAKIKEYELEVQRERDKSLKIAMDTKLREMEKAIEESRSGGNLGTLRIKELKDEIHAIKEMANELGEREKGAGEYISETIGNVAEKLSPAIQDYIRTKERQRPMVQELISEIPEPTQVQESGSSDLTAIEQQMSDQMSNMYIKKK